MLLHFLFEALRTLSLKPMHLSLPAVLWIRLRMDPHLFGCNRSESVFGNANPDPDQGIWIRIWECKSGSGSRSIEIDKIKKTGFLPFKKAFVIRRYVLWSTLNIFFMYLKGAQAWDIREQVFYTNQTCTDRRLGDWRKNVISHVGLFIWRFLLRISY